jgi:hypothetical protein
MRVAGAQFVAGAMPAAAPDAPAVDAVDLMTRTVWPGEVGKSVTGALDPSATAVALALSDDSGYWIVRAGVPDVAAPTLPTFRASLSFASTLSPGDYTFQVRAVDARGAFGPPAMQTLNASAGAPAAQEPAGDLVVTLTWDTEADLDLRVVDPSGVEIAHDHPQSTDAEGGIAGELDFDSNANCTIDGLRREDVVWKTAPPGRYTVRVDTPSLCGQPIAHFVVRAVLRGAAAGEAMGVSLDSDTWGPHGPGSGLLVLSFDVP